MSRNGESSILPESQSPILVSQVLELYGEHSQGCCWSPDRC